MPRFLLVDDSPVELRLVTGLLQKFEDAEIDTSTNGLEALRAARAATPDVVVSDLKMPGMDGLELIDAMRDEFPGVPIVIVTSQGSEEMAVRALQGGAAGYVPKRSIGRDLVKIVDPLVESAMRSRRTGRWQRCVRERATRLSLPNELEFVSETVQHVQEMLAADGFGDERDHVRIGVALHEALVNAMVHGNLDVSSELREHADGRYELLQERRRNESPYRERRVDFEVRIDVDRLWITIADEGDGFDVASVPDPTDPENVVRCSGRGILMMKSFLDDVVFNDRGNAVTLVKHRPVDTTAAVVRDEAVAAH